MTLNESSADRIVRAFVAFVALGVVLLSSLPPAGLIAVGTVGAIAAVTAIGGFCPLYRLLGISTCPAPRKTA